MILRQIKHTQSKVIEPVRITDYFVGSNLLANLHKINIYKTKNYSSFLLLSDTTIFKFYGNKVVSSLQKFGKPVSISLIKPGEKQKNLSAISNIIQPLFQAGFDRNTCLVALGGGVITDLGGFIASVLLRGIPAIYLPTTLLGQIDAAIGGKTGVDFLMKDNLMLKNMIGTIVQPIMVVSDVDTLSSLPQKEILNGLGEMAKYWTGWGMPSLDQLMLASTPGVECDELVKIITICQKIKIDTVSQDPYEKSGIRHKLNLGHTIGHAIEGASGGKLSHGQSVALGLAAVSKISLLKKMLAEETYQRIINALVDIGLPTKIIASRYFKTRSNLISDVNEALKLDKKAGMFVLIKDIGNLTTGMNVERELISQVLKETII